MSLQLFLTIFEGSPCCDIFHCDPKLTCAAPVESDYYSRQTNPLMAAGDFSRDLNLCAICDSVLAHPMILWAGRLTQI